MSRSSSSSEDSTVDSSSRNSKRRRRRTNVDCVNNNKEKTHRRRRHHHKSHHRSSISSSRRHRKREKESLSLSDDDERRRKRRKRKQRYDHDRHRRGTTNRRRSRSSSSSSSSSRTGTDQDGDHETITQVNQEHPTLVHQLYELFTKYPHLASELPYYLIRMASGSCINLSLVSETDQELVSLLETLFQTMNCTTESKSAISSAISSSNSKNSNREWVFQPSNMQMMANRRQDGNDNGNDRALSLVRWVRDELNRFGITMQKVQEYELSLQEITKKDGSSHHHNHDSHDPHRRGDHLSMVNDIACLTQMLLEKFSIMPTNTSSSTSTPSFTLAKELYDIFNMIQQHEIVSLDGISDEQLKISLEQLFLAIGLCREEMEDESENDSSNKERQEVAYGFVMPESQEEMNDEKNVSWIVERNLDAAINACKAMHQTWMQQQHQEEQIQNKQHSQSVEKSAKRILGPCRPPPLTALDIMPLKEENDLDVEVVEEEEDDFGPDPFTTSSMRKRTVPSISNGNQRKVNPDTQSSLENKREEWMMQPGEHDFLKGVLSKGIKSRTFRNEKVKDARLSSASMNNIPLDPKIQKQVDEIKKLHEEARGPSLMEQHRERIEKEKREKNNQKQGGWSWSRENDLDAGRRVDKSHLHMVMGGASSELKNKFQGSYSKTFD